MAGESQQVPASKPDPSVMTTEALERAITAERGWVEGQIETLRERLRGMDEATRVLHATVTQVPTDTQQAVTHLRQLHDEKFSSVAQQFVLQERQRVEQKADTQKAVDAALAAQKEAVKEQTTASERAIAKSETSTAEQLKQLSTTFSTSIAGLTVNLNDLKDRVGKIESIKQGGKEQQTSMYAFVGFLVSLLVLGGILAAAGVFSGK